MSVEFQHYYWLRVFEDDSEKILGRSNDPRIAQAAAEKVAFESSGGGVAIIVRSEAGQEIYRAPTTAAMS